MFNVKSLIVLTCIAFPMTAFAQSPEEKGLEIAMAAKAYDRGFTDFTANMVMTLKNKSGQTSKRLIRIRSLEVEGDGDKSLSIFDEPADVKGTKMLTYSHGLEADDQWLYLPALKKVKRISSRNKSGPFMGSTFAFEDLSSQEVEKYTYKYLRDEACGELSTARRGRCGSPGQAASRVRSMRSPSASSSRPSCRVRRSTRPVAREPT